VIQNDMGVLTQALKIIFQVQRKMSNEKIARRKISFPIYKMCFFFLEPSYFQSL
jgi:hypothetical protein